MATCIFNLVLLIIFLAPIALADTNGMGTSIGGAMAPPSDDVMSSHLHFTLGDTLWFKGWVIQSKAAMAGACILIFFLAFSERSLAAIRAAAEVAWRHQVETAYINAKNAAVSQMTIQACEAQSSSPPLSKKATLAKILTFRYITPPPFIPAHDIVRGILQASQIGMIFQLMLAAMTFNSAFLISIIVGIGVGEVAFGRYVSAAMAR